MYAYQTNSIGYVLQTTQTRPIWNLLEQTLNKITPDCEQTIIGNFSISFKNNTSLICKSYNFFFINIENRVKQLRLGHAHTIYNNWEVPSIFKRQS